MPSFLLLPCLLFFASKAQASELIIYSDEAVVIKKVAQSEETLQTLNIFKETTRLESYLDDLKYPSNSPFGVYIAFECTSITPVAARSIGPSYKAHHLTASGVLDVLEAFKGKSYGSLLLREVTKHTSQFLGQPLEYDSQEEDTLSHTFSCLCGDIEWGWGTNYPSLSVALKSGYGIACIAGSSTVQMLYSKDQTITASLWKEGRVNRLKNFSKFVMNTSSSTALIEPIVDDIAYILNDLDLTQETDIVTLLNMSAKVLEVLNAPESSKNENPITPEKIIYQKIHEGPLRTLFINMESTIFSSIKGFAEGQRLSNPQNLQIDLLYHCINPRGFDPVLNHFERLRSPIT